MLDRMRKSKQLRACLGLWAGCVIVLQVAKHETDKGDFLLKMGLVNKGGYVRVWVPDPPSKAVKAAAAGDAAAASAMASRPSGAT